MKKIIVLCCALFTFYASNSILANQIKDTVISVQGNCKTCKKTIESAVKSLEGIQKANWNTSTKKLSITFDQSIISLQKIEDKIAASGYDTDDVKATEESYNSLHSCCKYQRKP
jgi:periplasmic mercuric ion binding protein